MIYINWMSKNSKNPADTAYVSKYQSARRSQDLKKEPIYTNKEKIFISSNNIHMNNNKSQSFFKRLSVLYQKYGKKLGYKWLDFVKKSTRQAILDKINRYDQAWKQILHKAKLDTFADQMKIKYKMDQYKDQSKTKHKTDRYIKSYPMIPITIKDARTHELLLSNNKNKHKKSFLQLFRTRLDTIDRPKSDVSITINVSIRHMDGSITDKSYSPFQTLMPILNDDDKYKFVLYTLLNSNINLLSGESIFELGFDILKLEKRDIINHKMGRLKLENYLLQISWS